jgi:hypothetical protein
LAPLIEDVSMRTLTISVAPSLRASSFMRSTASRRARSSGLVGADPAADEVLQRGRYPFELVHVDGRAARDEGGAHDVPRGIDCLVQ